MTVAPTSPTVTRKPRKTGRYRPLAMACWPTKCVQQIKRHRATARMLVPIGACPLPPRELIRRQCGILRGVRLSCARIGFGACLAESHRHEQAIEDRLGAWWTARNVDVDR